MVNTFKNNRFRKIYASQAGIYSIQAKKYRDIRMNLFSNYYYDIFCQETAILSLDHKESLDSQITTLDYLQDDTQGLGIVVMRDEIVSQCASL